jgi:hypothetical protein
MGPIALVMQAQRREGDHDIHRPAVARIRLQVASGNGLESRSQRFTLLLELNRTDRVALGFCLQQ